MNHLPRIASGVTVPGMYGITFEADSRLSQYRQLVDQLRNRITRGDLVGGTRLASTRELSQSLALARGIVLEALDQLKMEGYLRTVHGSGTFICPNLVWNGGSPPSIAQRDSLVEETRPGGDFVSFVPGMPDLSFFPRRQWLHCYHKAVEYAETADLTYAPPEGRRDLREAIAQHLHETKGIIAGAERIVITAGASQAFAILAGIFPSPRLAMEDPQAPFVRRIFQGLGCRISYILVDEDGIIPSQIPTGEQDLIYVSPAHQFPLGGTLSAERRISLLQRAREIGAWVIEDDFDSEFRYAGHPITPLKVMAPERVVYVGTFTKNLCPALRIGYLVLPPGLQAKVKTLKRRWDLWNEGLQQKAMALFISEGHLERHLRRCHREYRQKNAMLRTLLAEQLCTTWQALGATTGMHLVLRYSGAEKASFNAFHFAQRLREKGIKIETVGEYCQENPGFRDCLIVAYGNRSMEELTRLVTALKEG